MLFQYIYYIGLFKDFIYAERAGYWTFYLVTVKRMPNFFASGSRINYAKNKRLYLLGMDEPPEKYPWLSFLSEEVKDRY